MYFMIKVSAYNLEYRIVRTIRHTTPQFGKKMRVESASYSLNVAYLAGGGGSGRAGSQEARAGPQFLLQKVFSYFPPLKPRCVLWYGVSFGLKNTVCQMPLS